jgi:hypothetical protein
VLRTLGVLGFITLAAAAGLYFAQRPTIARGDALAADLVRANPGALRALTCDPEVPIGVTGATFGCRAELANGATFQVQFALDRAGRIQATGEGELVAPAARAIKKTSDPWGD